MGWMDLLGDSNAQSIMKCSVNIKVYTVIWQTSEHSSGYALLSETQLMSFFLVALPKHLLFCTVEEKYSLTPTSG